MAHEADNHYGDILRACSGIIFMGTPHRGSDIASWTAVLSRIINIATLSQVLRDDLLRDLSRGSTALQTISRQFAQRGSMDIVSFYERCGTGVPPILVC